MGALLLLRARVATALLAPSFANAPQSQPPTGPPESQTRFAPSKLPQPWLISYTLLPFQPNSSCPTRRASLPARLGQLILVCIWFAFGLHLVKSNIDPSELIRRRAVREFESSVQAWPDSIVQRLFRRLHCLPACDSADIQHATLLTLGRQRILDELPELPVQAHHWGAQRVPGCISHIPGRGPVRDRDRHAGHQKPPGPGYAAAGVSILGHAGGRPSALSVVHGEGALDDALGDNDHTVRLAWAASGLRQRR